MALAATKTFVAAEILYASDLNALNTNILNNPMSLISPWTANLDGDGFDLVDLGELEFRDEAANPTATGRLRRNGSQLIWAIEDSRTNSTVRPLVVQATTTGVPSNSIGTGIEFRAESADENPCLIGALDLVALDPGAGSEDTAFEVRLRVAGAALALAYQFRTTGASATFSHANTIDRTYTLPDATLTVVGHDNTQTLTNKTIALGSNTVSGTLAQLNTAVTDADVVSIAGVETLTNKTLTSPTENSPTINTAAALSMGTNVGLVPAAVSGTPAQHALFRENVVKGWINFNGTGTIAVNDSFNVTSITDNGTGDYTITWDRDFADANYALGGFVRDASIAGIYVAGTTAAALTAGTSRINSFQQGVGPVDALTICVIAIGDQ